MLQNNQQLQQQYNQYQQQFSVGTTRCRRQIDTSACETCLAVHLQGGIHPAGAMSSSSALAVTPTPVHRGDATFWRFVSLTLKANYMHVGGKLGKKIFFMEICYF